MLAMFWVSLVWISNGNILSRFCWISVPCTHVLRCIIVYVSTSQWFCSLEAGANVWPGKELLPV